MPIPIFKYEFYYKDTEIKELAKAESKARIDISTVNYNDYLSGRVDELNVTISDPSGKWLKGWAPKQEDTISGTLWLGDSKFDLGEFHVSDFVYDYFPNLATLQCQSAAVPKGGEWRKKRNIKYKNTTLRTLVSTVAQRNDLVLQWSGDDIDLKEVYQRNQSDFGLIKSLAKTNGFFVKIHTRVKKQSGQRQKIKYLIFQTLAIAGVQLRRDGKVVSLVDGDGDRYVEITEKDLIGNAQFTLQSIAADRADFKKYVPYEQKQERVILSNNRKQGYDAGPQLPKMTPTGKIEGQANDGALMALLEETEGSISVIGNHRYVAGNVAYFTINGIHKGSYLIREANHMISPDNGWTVNLTLQKLSSKDLPEPKQRSRGRARSIAANDYIMKVGTTPIFDDKGNVVGYEKNSQVQKKKMEPPPSYYSGISGGIF
jgi:phage protein D